MKKLVCLSLLAFLTISLFAAPIFSYGQDGKLYVLNDDKTYKEFEEKVYSEDTGFTLNTSSINFLDQSWDQIRLYKLGNHLSSIRTRERYTTGEFYLLEFKVSTEKASTNSTWTNPVIKTDKGTVINGFSSELKRQVSTSSVNRVMGKRVNELVYTILYEIPEGETPSALGIKDTNSTDYTYTKLGSIQSF